MEKSFIWAKLRNKAWGTASPITLRNRSKETWFSVQFDVLSDKEHKTSQGCIPSRFQEKEKKKTSTYTANQYGLGTWEESLIISRTPALVSQEERHLLFIFDTDILYSWSACSFFNNQTDVQCMFDRPPAGCSASTKLKSTHKEARRLSHASMCQHLSAR